MVEESNLRQELENLQCRIGVIAAAIMANAERPVAPYQKPCESQLGWALHDMLALVYSMQGQLDTIIKAVREVNVLLVGDNAGIYCIHDSGAMLDSLR